LVDAIERMLDRQEWLAAERERRKFEQKIRRGQKNDQIEGPEG
jgi:hypothetical protein